MDVQLPAQPVDQSCFSEQRPLETQDVCSAGEGEEEDEWVDVFGGALWTSSLELSHVECVSCPSC